MSINNVYLIVFSHVI